MGIPSPTAPMRTRGAGRSMMQQSVTPNSNNGYAKLDSLSEELLDRIVHELSVTLSRRQDLLDLCRVRPLYAAALRHVWRRLAFDLAQVEKNERLLNALQARPDLGENIRRISLRREAFSTVASTASSGLERAIKLFRHAPALTDLEIKCRLRHAPVEDTRTDELDEALGSALSTFANTVKRFVLNPQLAEVFDDVSGGKTPCRLMMTKPFLRGFSAFSRLSVLDLWEVSFVDAPVHAVSPPSFKLMKLVMTRITIPAEQLKWLTASTAAGSSLVELDLKAVSPAHTKDNSEFIQAMISFLSAIAPSVRSLAIGRAVEGLFADEELTAPLFSRFTSLQRLTLDLRYVASLAWNALPTARLRHTLRAVDLQVLSSLPPSSITSLLGKLQPALRRVSITTHRGTPLVQVGTVEPQVWTWSRADRRSLRSLCITHSIPLEIDGIFEPDDVELSSADEVDIVQVGEEDEAPGEDPEMDDLFVLDDERRARYEEELTADFALLEEAKRKGDIDSQDEFMDALTSEEDDL